MTTLILKHNGHEALVPYELPESTWVTVFVPDHGICNASVLLRTEDIQVEEVGGPLSKPHCPIIPGAENHPAVLEQAGDVCAVFEHALGADHNNHLQSDVKVLSTIAEMALLESDLHTAWCRLPEPLRPSSCAPPDPRDPEESHAHHALQRFIEQVLVPRAQGMATAAAKRREAEWDEEQSRQALYARRAARTDRSIDIAKDRA